MFFAWKKYEFCIYLLVIRLKKGYNRQEESEICKYEAKMKIYEKTKQTLKRYGLIFATILSSSFGLSAHSTADKTEGGNQQDPIELIKSKAREDNIDTLLLKLDSAKLDTLRFSSTETCPPSQDINQVDSVLSDSLKTEQIPTDSVALVQYRVDQFNQSKEDMVKFLTLFENIKLKAYYDNVAKCYSVGLGFCYHKNGRKVQAGDRIKTEKDLFDMWDYYAEKHYLPQMLKYFKLENMTEEEKIAITSFMFNCGPAVVGSLNEYKPSAFTKAFNQWKETGDEKYLNLACSSLRARNKSRGQVIVALDKRRRIEEELLRGNILINEEQANLCGKAYLDLNSIVIGAFYSIGKLPKDNAQLMKKASEVNGRTYIDTLRTVFPVTKVSNKNNSGR